MSDLLEIFSTLLQFFSFILLATALVCVPLAVVLWWSELYGRIKTLRRGRRGTIPLTKIA